MYCPVVWGCKIHRLHPCRGVRPLPTSFLDMTRNNLMVRFQWCWDFGKFEAPLHCYCSQVHSGPEWQHLIELNCILMLKWIFWIRTVWQNWIVWNRNVFDNYTVYFHLNCVLMQNWIVWNGTIFDIETVLTLNWIVWYRTVSTFNCV